MSQILSDPDASEHRAARRLCRLFRIERAGGFDRRPAAVVRRVFERRGALIEELIAFERQRSDPPSLALLRALAELAEEVWRSRHYAETQLEKLRTELGLRHGEGPPTGLRGGAGGRLLGRG